MLKVIIGIVSVLCALTGLAYNTGEQWRWKQSSHGPALRRGDPIKLSWSIPNDGAEIPDSPTNNNLVATLKTKFGPTKPLEMMRFMFKRMGSVSGLEFVEVQDDNSKADAGIPGIPGKRGDIRVVGRDIGAPAGWCNMPGETRCAVVQMNTGKRSAGWSEADWINVTMHEIGHGVGLAHQRVFLTPTNSEPHLNATIMGLCNTSGPQLDDVYALHWLYGDKYERDGRNDTPATATDLGKLVPGTKSLGTDAASVLLGSEATDFLSIDSTNDVDCFRFELQAASSICMSASPQGPDYAYSHEGGQRVNFSPSRQSNLKLELLDSNGAAVEKADKGELGEPETIVAILPAGRYHLRVSGTEDNTQLYRLDLSVSVAAR